MPIFETSANPTTGEPAAAPKPSFVPSPNSVTKSCPRYASSFSSSLPNVVPIPHFSDNFSKVSLSPSTTGILPNLANPPKTLLPNLVAGPKISLDCA